MITIKIVHLNEDKVSKLLNYAFYIMFGVLPMASYYFAKDLKNYDVFFLDKSHSVSIHKTIESNNNTFDIYASLKTNQRTDETLDIGKSFIIKKTKGETKWN